MSYPFFGRSYFNLLGWRSGSWRRLFFSGVPVPFPSEMILRPLAKARRKCGVMHCGCFKVLSCNLNRLFPGAGGYKLNWSVSMSLLCDKVISVFYSSWWPLRICWLRKRCCGQRLRGAFLHPHIVLLTPSAISAAIDGYALQEFLFIDYLISFFINLITLTSIFSLMWFTMASIRSGSTEW